jgi:hypothetical protein
VPVLLLPLFPPDSTNYARFFQPLRTAPLLLPALRVFGVEIEGCARCGGKLGIIASIEEPQIIALILGRIAPAVPV